MAVTGSRQYIWEQILSKIKSFPENAGREIMAAHLRGILDLILTYTFNKVDDHPLTIEDLVGLSAVPPGGEAGQVLKKNSENDYDAGWKDEEGGQTLETGSGVTIGQDGKINLGGQLTQNVSFTGAGITTIIGQIGAALGGLTAIMQTSRFGINSSGWYIQTYSSNLVGATLLFTVNVDTDAGNISFVDEVNDLEILMGAKPDSEVGIYARMGNANYYTLLGSDVGAAGAFALISQIPSLTGYATQSWVQSQISALVDAAPDLLNTFNEIANALGNDPNFATTIMNMITAVQNALNALQADFEAFVGVQVGDFGSFQELATAVLSLQNTNLGVNQTNTVPSALTFTGNDVYGTEDNPLTNLSAIPPPDLTDARVFAAKIFFVKQASEPAISINQYKIDDRYEFAPDKLNKIVVIYEYGVKPSVQGVAYLDDVFTVTGMSMTGVHNLGKTYRLATDVLTANFTSLDANNDPGPGEVQWMKASDSAGTNAVPISGATNNTYTLAGDELYVGFKVDGVQIGTFLQVKNLSLLAQYTEALGHKSSTGYGTPAGAGNLYITLITSDDDDFTGTILNAVAQGASATYNIGDQTNVAKRLSQGETFYIEYDHKCISTGTGNQGGLRMYFNLADNFANASYHGSQITNSYITIKAGAAVPAVKEKARVLVENATADDEFGLQMPNSTAGDRLIIQNLKVYKVL